MNVEIAMLLIYYYLGGNLMIENALFEREIFFLFRAVLVVAASVVSTACALGIARRG